VRGRRVRPGNLASDLYQDELAEGLSDDLRAQLERSSEPRSGWPRARTASRSRADSDSGRASRGDSDRGADSRRRRRVEVSAMNEHEAAQVERANASGLTPVVFVQGSGCCRRAGTGGRRSSRGRLHSGQPRLAGRSETVEEAKAHPEVFAKKSVGDIADYLDAIVRRLTKKPAIIGHSFGGLLTQILAGRGSRPPPSRSTPRRFARPSAPDLVLAICVARVEQSRELQPRSPAHLRAVPLRLRTPSTRRRRRSCTRRTRCQVRVVPLFQAATATQPLTEAKVDTKNPERGPLLILVGDADHTVPRRLQRRRTSSSSETRASPSTRRSKGRGHALVNRPRLA